MPSLIQVAFAVEALFNTPAVISLLFFPSQILKYLLATPLPSLELNATATLLGQAFGAVVFALTVQILLAYPDTQGCAGKRKLVYWTLGAGEAGLVPLLLWEAFRASDESKAVGVWAGGFSRRASLGGAVNGVLLLGWRIWALWWRPEWFGESGDVIGGENKKAE